MRVLIAVEDEKFGAAIVDFIGKHRWAERTEFKVIHCVEPLLVGSYMSIFPSPLLDDLTAEHHKYGKELLQKTKEQIESKLPGHAVSTEIIEEIPKVGIVDHAREWKADLIVMGSHGRRGLDRFLLGSVAESVSSHADCSVTIVRVPKTSGLNQSPDDQ